MLVTRRNGQFTDSGVVRKDIPSLVLLFRRWPTFCFGCVGRGNCLFLLCWVTARCFLRFFVSSFLRSLLRPLFKISFVLLRWRLLVMRFVLHHGIWRQSEVICALLVRTSSVLFPAQSYEEDPLFSFLGYGQTGGGDSGSVSCGLVFLHGCWSFICSRISC